MFTALLSIPAATSAGTRASFADALFTATSAVSVTGLTTVNTGDYWSTLGHVIILAAIKVGGLGVMTLASLLGFAVSATSASPKNSSPPAKPKPAALGRSAH